MTRIFVRLVRLLNRKHPNSLACMVILLLCFLCLSILHAEQIIKVEYGNSLTRVQPEIIPPQTSPSFLASAPLINSAEGLTQLQKRTDQISSKNRNKSGAIVITPEISQLSRGLKHDPQLIYEFVRNNIKYIPMYGLHRGATMTLLDRRGNDIEQTALLIALMREAGYTASFIYGSIQLTPAQVDSWLGVGTDPDVLELYLGGGGLLGAVNRSGQTLLSVDLDHVWAKVNISGTDYVFDPSIKNHTVTTGINLTSAMGYDKATFLSNAGSGMTSTADYVQNVNRTNIRTDLTTYTANLISLIQTTMPGATLDDIIGGYQIDPETGQAFQTTLPYETVRAFEWNEVPVQYQALLTIEHLGIDETFATADVYGRRLDMMYVFDTTLNPYLYLEGTTMAVGDEVTETPNLITLSVDHPYSAYGGTFCDESTSTYIKAGGLHTVAMMWGGAGRDSIEYHRQKLKEYQHQGYPINTEPTLGEGLMELGFIYLTQITRAAELGDRLAGTATIYHHELGLVGQGAAPYTHVVSKIAMVSLDENDSNKLARAYALTGINSAFEWGCIDQSQPISAVSTIKLFDQANSLSHKIFDSTSSNYYATVKGQLQDYTTTELDMFDAFIDGGYRLFIPEHGNLQDNEWQGIAYIWVSPAGDFMGNMISQGLAGGSGNEDAWLDADATGSAMPDLDHTEMNPMSSEPIDLVTGYYSHAALDLSVGYGDPPFGLALFRTYSSGSCLNRGFFGYGWSHNWEASAGETSDGLRGMGDGSPVEAAASIVELYLTTDILRDGLLADRLLFAITSHRWLIDSLIDNVVNLKSIGTTLQFIKLVNGEYTPARAVQAQLSKEGDDSYLLTTKHGNQVDFNTAGKLISWQDWNSNAVNFTYSSGRLTEIDNNLGERFTFSYDGHGYISHITDHTGRSVAYSYDNNGYLVSVLDPEVNQIKYEYDASGRMTKIFQPSDLNTQMVTNTYDDFDRVISQVDGAGNTYTYYYALTRTEEVDPKGHSRVYYFNQNGHTIKTLDALEKVITYEYDGLDRRTKMTLPEGNGTSYTYDGSTDKITQITVFPKSGSINSPHTTSITYDPTTNRINSVTDALGRTTSYTYDANGNLTRMEYPQVNGETPTVTLTSNARGQITQVENPEGTIKTRQYNSNAEPTVTTFDQGGTVLSTSVTYDAVGNITSFTDARGNSVSFAYDHNRGLTLHTCSAPFSYQTKLTRDKNRNVEQIERQTSTGWKQTSISTTTTGDPGSIADDEGRIKSFIYDETSKLWKIGNHAGHSWEFQYDERGFALQVKDPLGNLTEQYTYTDNGLLQTLQDARGNTLTYQYDDFDRIWKRTFADTTVIQYTYNEVNKITQINTRAGDVISFQYDNLNRLKQKTLPGPVTHAYIHDLVGRMTAATNATGSIQFNYDTFGWQTSVIFPGNRTVSYEYDQVGNRTKITYPDGYFVTYTYDALDRLTHIYENGTTLLAEYSYDELSRISSLTYLNGSSMTVSYSDASYTKIQDFQFASEAVQFSYAYDSVGNLSSLTTSNSSFDYFPPTEELKTYTSNNLNQYSQVNAQSFTYDGNGNLTTDGLNTYTFNVINKLVSATTAQHTVTFEYDALGKRLAKTVDGTRTEYVYDGPQCIAEYDQSGSIVRRYIYGPLFDCPIVMQTGGSTYFYHQDRNGSVIALSNAAGERVETFTYSAFGLPNQTSSLGNQFLFTGKMYDAEPGLYYYRARYYNPILGRFLSPDPLGPEGGGLNLYRYCQNNPVNIMDPTGMKWLPWPLNMIEVEGGKEDVMMKESLNMRSWPGIPPG